jgi:hypothetical protein
MLENFHIIKATIVRNATTAKVRLTSERFRQSIIIKHNDQFSFLMETAEWWLLTNGFELTGKGESKDGMYFISNTFKKLQK